MKRDMDLIRQLLLKIEGSETRYADDLDIPGYSRQEIGYHLELLISATLINCDRVGWTFGGDFGAAVNGLTWEGHDFVEAIRSDSIWNRTKESIRDRGLDVGSLPIELLKSVAIDRIKEMLM